MELQEMDIRAIYKAVLLDIILLRYVNFDDGEETIKLNKIMVNHRFGPGVVKGDGFVEW
jgi:hypothetical protein